MVKTHYQAAGTALLLLIIALVFVKCHSDEPIRKSESLKEARSDSLQVSLIEASEVASAANAALTGATTDSSARIGGERNEIVDQVTIRDSQTALRFSIFSRKQEDSQLYQQICG